MNIYQIAININKIIFFFLMIVSFSINFSNFQFFYSVYNPQVTNSFFDKSDLLIFFWIDIFCIENCDISIL